MCHRTQRRRMMEWILVQTQQTASFLSTNGAQGDSTIAAQAGLLPATRQH